MKSILRFVLILFILTFATIFAIPLIILIVDAVNNVEESFLFKLYKEI